MTKPKKTKPTSKPKECALCHGYGERCDYCGDPEDVCSCQAEADNEANEDFEPSSSECKDCNGTGQGS